MVREIIIISILLISAISDIKFRKVPNAITIPFFLIGLTTTIINKGISSLPTVLINLFIIIMIFGHGFYKNYIGGGDIKLFMGIACWTEFKVFVTFIFMTSICGAAFALYNLFIEYKVYQGILNVKKINQYSIQEKIHLKSGKKIAYGVCIFIGYFLTLWMVQ